jgi:hypothetical protein
MKRLDIPHPPSKEQLEMREKIKNIRSKNRMSLELAVKCYDNLKDLIQTYDFVTSETIAGYRVRWSAKLTLGFKRLTFQEFLRIYHIEIVEV